MHFLRSRGHVVFLTSALSVAALVVACSSSDSGTGGDDAGSSGSSGFAETGTSSGETGTSGSSGSTDGATKDGATPETTCDPAKTDCKTGEVCTSIGRATPVCRPGCTKDSDCTGTPKSGCVITTPGTPETGACIPTCKPFGTDCAAGFTCSRVPEQAGGVTQTSTATFCKPTGATPLLSNCANDPGSCGANADCIFFQDKGEGVNDSKCHTLCDPTHACPGGGGDVCYTKMGDTFGFCHDG